MRLKEIRKAAGLTQKDVATYVGVSQNTYSYWENGKTKIDVESLGKLAKLFNVSIDYILDGAAYKASIESYVKPKTAERTNEEKLLGIFRQLDNASQTQLMSVAYLILSNTITSSGVSINQIIEQQLHKNNEGGDIK